MILTTILMSRNRPSMEQRTLVLIGYMRVSKADGSQVLDLQRDALLAAGVTAEHLYEDSGLPSFSNRTEHFAEHRLCCQHLGELFDQGL